MRIITETNHPHAEPNTKQTNYFGRRTKTTEADSAQRSYKGFVWATYSFMGFFNRRCGELVFLPCTGKLPRGPSAADRAAYLAFYMA